MLYFNKNWVLIYYDEMAVETKPDFAAGYVRLGDIYADSGSMSEAIAAYKKAVDVEPGLLTAHRNLALLYIRMKDYKKGVTELEAVLEINPGDQMACQMLAYCRRAESEEQRIEVRGQRTESKKLFAQGSKLKTYNP